MGRTRRLPEVLTLTEVARYLRLPKETVRQYAAGGDLPARQFGKEWRFLKAAVDDWLRRPNGRTALLQTFGAFAGDEQLLEICEGAYEARRKSAAGKDSRR